MATIVFFSVERARTVGHGLYSGVVITTAALGLCQHGRRVAIDGGFLL